MILGSIYQQAENDRIHAAEFRDACQRLDDEIVFCYHCRWDSADGSVPDKYGGCPACGSLTVGEEGEL